MPLCPSVETQPAQAVAADTEDLSTQDIVSKMRERKERQQREQQEHLQGEPGIRKTKRKTRNEKAAGAGLNTAEPVQLDNLAPTGYVAENVAENARGEQQATSEAALISRLIRIECRGWEDTAKLPPGSPPAEGKRHVRYIIAVNNCGQQHELRKRWQELYELSSSIPKLDKYVPKPLRWRANGEKPLPKKYGSANFVTKELEARMVEVTAFCDWLSHWLTQLVQSKGNPNLLNPSQSGDAEKNRLANFFALNASYDAFRSTVAWTGGASPPPPLPL